MRQIPIYDRSGLLKTFALVDDEWYDRLIVYQWHDAQGYPVHSHFDGPTRVVIKMHRLVAGATVWDECVDHIDMNPLNNQAHNLRVADRAQNGWNRKLNKNNTTGFKGVSWSPRHQLFESNITVRKKQHHLGKYKTAEDAHAAYQAAALKLHGEFANFGHGCVILDKP